MTIKIMLGLALKVALSAGLIFYVSSRIDIAAAVSQIESLPPLNVILAIVLLLAQFFLAAERLRVMLATVGSRLKRSETLDAVMIGAFFSQTMISFLGGDAMRVWHIARQEISVGNATKAVFYDRVLGLLGLILVVAIGLPFLFQAISDPRIHSAIIGLI